MSVRPATILLAVSVAFASRNTAAAARLTPEASSAFDHYIERVEAELNRPGPYLWLDVSPQDKAAARRGDVVVKPVVALDNGQPFDVPNGQIQDWQGAIFIPGVKLERVSKALLNYGRYPEFYKPEVVQARLLSGQGGNRHVFLRLYRKDLLTVVLDTEYAVEYRNDGPGRMHTVSRSTKISEVKHPGRGGGVDLPPGEGFGFLWRLNSYWHFEETPDGVFATCRAVSLSRDIPFGFGWMLRDFLDRFPRESMAVTLEGTRKAGLAR